MPTLSPETARDRFLSARVARLATVSAAGDPHLVPITFAQVGPDVLINAVDHKPKRTTALTRLDNIAVHPTVTLLVDFYDDDWSQLWWARADGQATVLGPEPATPAREAVRDVAIRQLTERYRQYAEHPPDGVLIQIAVTRWSGWSARAI